MNDIEQKLWAEVYAAEFARPTRQYMHDPYWRALEAARAAIRAFREVKARDLEEPIGVPLAPPSMPTLLCTECKQPTITTELQEGPRYLCEPCGIIYRPDGTRVGRS